MEVDPSNFINMIDERFGNFAGDILTTIICLGIIIWVSLFIFRRVILPMASSLEKATEFKKVKHQKIASVLLWICVFIVVIFTSQLTIDSVRLSKESVELREKIQVITQHEKDIAKMSEETKKMHEKVKKEIIKKYGPLE